MKTLRMGTMIAVVLATLIGCGEANDDPASTLDVGGETVEVIDGGKSDISTGEWKAKAPSMTMWLRTTLEPSESRGQAVWILRGRVSKSLAHVRAYDRDGYDYTTRVRGDRKFEVILSGRELTSALAGDRLFFDFVPRRGDHGLYHGMTRLGARFAKFDGSSRIFVFRAVNPIYNGSELRFRGRVSTADGFELESVYTDDDAAPAVADEHDRWRLDWTPELMLLAAHPADDPVHFVAVDTAGGRVEKTAEVHFRITQLGLTVDEPFTFWPAQECADEVSSCLEELPEDEFDTETCGWANEVRACQANIEAPLGVTPKRFAADLKEELEMYYEHHGQRIAHEGGNSLEEALDAVDPSNVETVDDYEEGEYWMYDPRYYEIFYHPDVVEPDSARIWYGVYEPSGKRVLVYAVND